MKISSGNDSVFISYRREGGDQLAQLVKGFLEAHGLRVFLDVDDLSGGHYDDQILRNIEATDVLILICSKGCLDRCVKPDDWVRRELEHAISLNKLIVPILNQGFEFPSREKLPESIRTVVRHQAFKYSHEHWSQSRQKLLKLIGVDPVPVPGAPRQAEPTPRPSTVEGEVGVGLDTKSGSDYGHTKDLDSSCPADLIRLTSLANQGNANAQFTLGLRFTDGRGVERSDSQAVFWFRKSAEQGNALAQFNLGFMYLHGRGVETSSKKAALWFQEAAVQGDRGAQCNLAAMFERGRGVERSYKQAVFWYRQAAEQGDAYAQDSLNRLLDSGYGFD